jgi:hypothetical protein
MTYTFKLARRLAVSRALSRLPLLLALAACSETDTTAPHGSVAGQPESGTFGWRSREATPVAVQIKPNQVLVETNQLIQLQARGLNRAGDNVVAPISWGATGGTILPDGRFSAAMTGTYQIIGRTRIREDFYVADTSTITVVRRQIGIVRIKVSPDTVTLTPGTSRLFTVVGLVRSGQVKPVGAIWSATGGTVDPGGNYVAGDTAGSYLVIATNLMGTLSDTSRVTIAAPPSLPPPADTTPPTPPAVERVPPPPSDSTPTPAPPPADTTPEPAPLPPPPPPPPPPTPSVVRVTLTPSTATLTTGATKQFTATATWSDSSTTPVTSWTSTGGTVTSSGLYSAGTVAGSYRVIATTGGLADTASITITQPAPTLVRVTLMPATATLAPGTSKQFSATAKWSDSSTTSVNTWLPTGGTVTSAGLYTAGSSSGAYRLIATASGKADTSSIAITQPLGSGSAVGIAYGAFGLMLAGVTPPSMNLSLDGYQPYNIISRIDAARANRMHLVLAMTGGGHSNYMTNGVFDRSKWNAKMDLFNTPEIRTAVAGGVADGTIIGASVMDEPQVSGAGADGNTWGPPGTMTKARVDSLCGYVKAIFPTLPAGVVHRHDVFEPTKSYRVCDFIASQYSARVGSVTTFRDGGLAMAQRDGHAIMFSMNILNGGTQDKDGTWDCGGAPLGQDPPNCQMTAAQLRDFGSVLGPAGCGLLMWRYDQTFLSRTDNKQAFADVAALLASQPAKQCRRK